MLCLLSIKYFKMKNKNIKKIITKDNTYDLNYYWEWFCKDCIHEGKWRVKTSDKECNLCKARMINPTHFKEKE